MRTTVKLKCDGCNIVFDREKSKHEYNLRNGRKWVSCSRKCLSIISVKHYARRKPKVLTLKCFNCSKNFNVDFHKNYARRKRGTKKSFCSVKCKSKFQRKGGVNSTSWRGGRHQYDSIGGYVLVRVATNKRVMEHRLVMEKHIGRPLTKKEVVHHINGKPWDNRIENLVLCKTSGKHRAKYHNRDGSLKNV